MTIGLVSENTIPLKEAADILPRRGGRKISSSILRRRVWTAQRPLLPKILPKSPAEWLAYLQLAAMAEG